MYLRLPLKSTGSCWMIASAPRSRGSPKPRWSTPSIRMRPAASSTWLGVRGRVRFRVRVRVRIGPRVKVRVTFALEPHHHTVGQH